MPVVADGLKGHREMDCRSGDSGGGLCAAAATPCISASMRTAFVAEWKLVQRCGGGNTELRTDPYGRPPECLLGIGGWSLQFYALRYGTHRRALEVFHKKGLRSRLPFFIM